VTEFASEDPTVMGKDLNWVPIPLRPECDDVNATDDDYLNWFIAGRKGVE